MNHSEEHSLKMKTGLENTANPIVFPLPQGSIKYMFVHPAFYKQCIQHLILKNHGLPPAASFHACTRPSRKPFESYFLQKTSLQPKGEDPTCSLILSYLPLCLSLCWKHNKTDTKQISLIRLNLRTCPQQTSLQEVLPVIGLAVKLASTLRPGGGKASGIWMGAR